MVTNPLNPFSRPEVHYLTAFLRVHLDAARSAERSRGASAVEWAIIVGVATAIALGVGLIIRNEVKSTAEGIDMKFDP